MAMNQRVLSAIEAQQLARSQFEQAIALLHSTDHMMGEISAQLPVDPAFEELRWKLKRHLNPDWQYFSQSGQDRFVFEEFFPNSGPGVFLDVGAYDGVIGSNTLFFERVLGWNGICVEASPSLFPLLQKNRRVSCWEAAVADRSATETFIEIIEGYTQMGGLTRDAQQLSALRTHARHSERQVEIVTRTLTEILVEESFDTIDYCSIDVEGSELRVLQGLDFDRWRIKVFSVENATHYSSNRPSEVRILLESKGYRYVQTIGYDEVFVQSES